MKLPHISRCKETTVLYDLCFCLIYTTDEAPNMDETIRQANIDLQAENRNLQALNTSLHKKYHTISLKVSYFEFWRTLVKLN